MENSLVDTFSATAIALATAIPAGYGLATTQIRGRKLLLVLTTIAMVMPAISLVWPGAPGSLGTVRGSATTEWRR
jgi:multiple sugar transport system permease protein